MESPISKIILWSFLEGKSTPAQDQILKNWLLEPANQEMFYDVLHQWEKENPQIMPLPEQHWEELSVRMFETGRQDPEQADLPIIARPGRAKSVWWLAAAIVFLFALGLWQRETVLHRSYACASGQTRQIILPDSSRVVLMGSSKLSYPRFTWLSRKRVVSLQGYGRFSVVHTEDDKPFVIHTANGLEVRVLGTEFIVNDRSRESKVTLTEGRIQLRSLKNADPPIDVQPGEVVRVSPMGTFKVSFEVTDPESMSTEIRPFVFNKTSLREISDQMDEKFGIRLVIPDSALAAKQLTGTYPADNAEETLLMISKLLNVRFTRLSDGKVLLTGTDHKEP